jgi:phenylalanyl-tRNA synthetase beta chain
VDALAAQGVHEIVGWSFVAPELQPRLRIADAPSPVLLRNPMSGDQSQLRRTLLGSLLDAARRNRAHGAAAIRLFESGAVYLANPDGHGLPAEPHHVAALLSGPARQPTWRDPEPPPADYFAIKGVLGALLDTLRVPFEVERSSEPFLHPGRSGTISVAEEPVGWIGELHPLVAADWELDGPVAAFELDLDAVAGMAPEVATYVERTGFPQVREDLAVIVADEIPAADVLAVVREAGSPLLQSAEVFDVYRDIERIGAENVSLAVRLTYAAPDRTLTDEDVAAQRAQISSALSQRLSGRVRTGD